jgi:hypothetical protein
MAAAPQQNSGGLFGAATQQKQLFGAAPQQQQILGGLFGAPMNAMAAAPQKKSGGLFGSIKSKLGMKKSKAQAQPKEMLRDRMSSEDDEDNASCEEAMSRPRNRSP